MKKRIAVLASGRGSNFQAVIDAIHDGKIPATCAALITDNPKAYAIERAKKAKIPVTVIDFASFPSREMYEKALLTAMQQVNVNLFVLAGYMRIVGAAIVRSFPGKIMNIHPALLPAFPGLHAQRQAVHHGVKVSGCTVAAHRDHPDLGLLALLGWYLMVLMAHDASSAHVAITG